MYPWLQWLHSKCVCDDIKITIWIKSHNMKKTDGNCIKTSLIHNAHIHVQTVSVHSPKKSILQKKFTRHSIKFIITQRDISKYLKQKIFTGMDYLMDKVGTDLRWSGGYTIYFAVHSRFAIIYEFTATRLQLTVCCHLYRTRQVQYSAYNFLHYMLSYLSLMPLIIIIIMFLFFLNSIKKG